MTQNGNSSTQKSQTEGQARYKTGVNLRNPLQPPDITWNESRWWIDEENKESGSNEKFDDETTLMNFQH